MLQFDTLKYPEGKLKVTHDDERAWFNLIIYAWEEWDLIKK